jgi:5-methylcytosine-specific restriction enzyme subunit McrC
MAHKNTIRVAEFEKLYHDEGKPFKHKHWQALFNYQELQNKNGINRVEYFRVLPKGIQFLNYVGVIQAGNLTIEVLPKTDRNKTTASNASINDLNTDDKKDRLTWHNVLLRMLNECSLLKINHVDRANLNLKNNSIFDIYLKLFLSETETLLHEGLIKKYKTVESNKFALKGQLQFSKNISKNLVHQERFYVRHTEYNSNNIFNKILLKTICLIKKVTNNNSIRDLTDRLLIDFPELPDCTVSLQTFEKLVYDRKTERYKEAMLISKMLLLNYRPDITGGSESVIAILFDMNKLWEEFVYRRLKKEEVNFSMKVQRQLSAAFWQSSIKATPNKIRPDIVITHNSQTIIIDTKWKIVKDLLPRDDDLKQMFVYNLFWNCEKSVLLYPSNNDENSFGDYHDFTKVNLHNTKCAVETINIFDDKKYLDKELGKRLARVILR